MGTLQWARRLQAIAQNGLAYNHTPFDEERYGAVREIAAEMMASTSDGVSEHVLDLFAQQIGHATPKVDVRGAVFQNSRILLVKERSDGLWTLPGGWADVGEAPSVAVEREIAEESGYVVQAVKLAMVYDRDQHGHPPLAFHVYKLFFVCNLVRGEAASSIETDGAEFFAEMDLPHLSESRVVRAEIIRLFDHARQPLLPTDFD